HAQIVLGPRVIRNGRFFKPGHSLLHVPGAGLAVTIGFTQRELGVSIALRRRSLQQLGPFAGVLVVLASGSMKRAQTVLGIGFAGRGTTAQIFALLLGRTIEKRGAPLGNRRPGWYSLSRRARAGCQQDARRECGSQKGSLGHLHVLCSPEGKSLELVVP